MSYTKTIVILTILLNLTNCFVIPQISPEDINKNFQTNRIEFIIITREQENEKDEIKQTMRILEKIFSNIIQSDDKWANSKDLIDIFEVKRSSFVEQKFGLQNQSAEQENEISNDFLDIEIVCRMGNIITNYSKELSSLYSSRKKRNDQDEMITFSSVWNFVKSKYDLSEQENEILFMNWVNTIANPIDLKIYSSQEIFALKQSHLALLYIIPELEQEEFQNEIFKILSLRKIFFTIPFLWSKQNEIINSLNKKEEHEHNFLGKKLMDQLKILSHFVNQMIIV